MPHEYEFPHSEIAEILNKLDTIFRRLDEIQARINLYEPYMSNISSVYNAMHLEDKKDE